MRFFRRPKFESDMDAELQFHLEAYIDDLLRTGVPRAEALRRARLEFGALESTKDACRQAWGLQFLDELRADLRYALRTLRRSPAFAAVAILSLALGIGANTAIFGLVDAVLLRLLPVRDPQSLVFIENVGTGEVNGGPPYPCFELLRDQARSFESMAAFSASNMEMVVNGTRELVRGVYVSGNFYHLLGVKPILGRAITPADDQIVGRGGPDGPVAVISRDFWRQRFGGDPAVIGKNVGIATIVGILPSNLMSVAPGRPIDIAVPMMLSDPATLRNRGAWWMDILARLKPGVRPERARTEADAIFQSYMSTVSISPDIRKLAFDHIEIPPAGGGMPALRMRFSKPLAALLILAGLVLLAACVTVANLMLARASARQKEFAIRLAIGAGRGRLIRQTLTEALVLVSVGASLGIVLERQGEAALVAYFSGAANPVVLDVSTSSHVLLFALGVSFLTGIAFGLLPALRATRAVRVDSPRVVGTRSSLRLGRALVVLQVALSMVLLAGAGLFLHSLQRLESVDLGFTRQGIVTMDVTPERDWFGSPQWIAAQADILDRVKRLPGVQSAAWSTMTPLNGRDRSPAIDVPGFLPHNPNDRIVHLASVSPEFFKAFGMTLLRGRGFTSHEGAAAILNDTAARFYFAAADPIGRKLLLNGTSYEIVGILKDAKHVSVRGQPLRFLYLPVSHTVDRVSRLTLSVRGPSSLPITKEVLAIRPTLLISNTSTIERQVEASLLNERLVSALSTAFAMLALLLACIGLYGMLGYAVSRRTSEIGIRMALGATGRSMTWLILQESLLLAAAGIAIGILPVIALARAARALLFGVDAFDPQAFGAALLILLGFAALAGIVPARRAGRLDPMTALRCE